MLAKTSVVVDVLVLLGRLEVLVVIPEVANSTLALVCRDHDLFAHKENSQCTTRCL